MGYGTYLLLHYGEIKAHISLLEQELETVQAVSGEEMIEVMALSRDMGQSRSGKGTVKDRTGAVALVYQEAAWRLNHSTKREIALDLEVTRGELCRLERVLETLPCQQRDVLKGLYLAGKTGAQLCEELEISPRSLYRYRKAGLERLDAMIGGRCH